MKRRWLGTIASTAIGLALFIALVKLARIDFVRSLRLIGTADRAAILRIVALTAIHVYLSNVKWRCVDAYLRDRAESAPTRLASYVLTSAGVALGQVLPVQVSMSAVRSLGVYVHGRALRRGAFGTLFEQGFDVLVMAALTVAAAMTWAAHWGPRIWAASATLAVALLVAAIGPATRLLQRWLLSARNSRWEDSRLFRKLRELRESGILRSGLAKKLAALSIARYIVQVLIASQVAAVIGADISLWQLAAAIPVATLMAVVSITPGALGVAEIGFVGALHLFGVPVDVAGGWAVASRFLVGGSSFVVAGCAASLLAIRRWTVRSAKSSAKQWNETRG